MPNCGSLLDTQLKMERRYVFSSPTLIFSCRQLVTSNSKASHFKHLASVLSELAFSSKASLAPFSANSERKLGHDLQAPNTRGLALISSSSSIKVAYLVWRVAKLDIWTAHSSQSVSSDTWTLDLANSSSLKALSHFSLNSFRSLHARLSNLL